VDYGGDGVITTLKNLDWTLFFSIVVMCGFGLVMVYSSSFVVAAMVNEDPAYFYKKQRAWLIISLTGLMIMAITPYSLLGKLTPLMVFGSIFMLVLVLIPGIGVERNYSQRWIGAGPVLIQPSEICKLTMIIYFAYVYAKKQTYLHHFVKGILPPLVVLTFVCGLILLQPDLGTATSIIVACGTILICSGARLRHLVFLAAAAFAFIAVFAFSESYRMERLTSYKDPFADPSGSGYQLINSYLSISQGGLSGLGLGNSIQKYGYLPEAHTDFIMAIIAEELGLKGVLLVFLFFFLILFKGVFTSLTVEDPFGKMLAIGITLQICSQAIFNMGAVTGLLPITGITLPFISYGGSSLVVTCLSAGILLNISAHRKKQERGQAVQLKPTY
jgi:cell division protein FtsW